MADCCNFAWPADPMWGEREHECDLDAGHDGDHACGWCIACEFGTETHPQDVPALTRAPAEEPKEKR